MGCKSSKDVKLPYSCNSNSEPVETVPPLAKDESPARKLSTTLRLSSVNSLERIASSGNLDSTFAISLPSVQEEPSKTLSLKLETRCSNNIRTQPLVFVFDSMRSKFIAYNVQKNILQTNELNLALVEPESEILETILSQLDDMSSIAVSDSIIHLIGERHLIYDIKFNKFTLQALRLHPCKNPLLYKLNETIFAISGVGSTMNAACEKYDIKTNKWSTLPPLPQAHAEGTVCGMVNQAGAQKLVAIGGYSKVEKGKKTINPNMSVYDLSHGLWTTKKLEISSSKLKCLIRPRVFVKEDRKLAILTPETIMELDMMTCQVKEIRALPKEDKVTRIESFCHTYKDQIALIGSETEEIPQRTRLKNLVLVIGNSGDLTKWNYRISLC